MNEGWVTKDQVAEHLGISTSSVDRLVEKGLPSLMLGDGARGGARRFRIAEVDEWLREHGNGDVPA